ncbi:SMC-Scp complex subunit ScpB [Dyella sp. Tek66A03]|jgi:segregation and condensation protein B|uniref:SMC-Scp complex subunit ScpB n=1 Tax=Dyella sp. Tek66A03 TaxID=3458298 RepID=UPI0031B9339C
MQIEQLKPIIEAALLATTQPMTIPQLLELFGEEDEVGRDDVAKALEALAEDCTGRGVELHEVASGFRYQVRQDMHQWLSKMWTERPSRYSRALLETLALIAYRQPITRPEIEQIRGVVVSSSIIKTMEEREWIRVVGYRDVPGKPALFGTTRAFLDYFNLKSLDELPPLSEIRDMEDPQMRIDQNPLPARIVRDLPIDPDEENEPLVVAGEEAEAITDEPSEPTDSELAQKPAVTEAPSEEQALTFEVASAPSEPGAATHAESTTDTADEAATRADADHGDATQDTEEYRA